MLDQRESKVRLALPHTGEGAKPRQNRRRRGRLPMKKLLQKFEGADTGAYRVVDSPVVMLVSNPYIKPVASLSPVPGANSGAPD